MTASSSLLLLPLLCVGAALGKYAPEFYNVEYDEAKERGEKFVDTEELVGAGHHGGVVGYDSYGGIVKEEHEEVEGYQSKVPYNPYKVFEQIIGLKDEPRCSIRGPKECNPHERYRSIDGTCNNLLRPTLGAAGTTYSRLLPPRYSAGTCEPARSVTGYPLPLSRKLSRELFPSKPINDPKHTLLTVHWGQVVVHDTTLIAGNPQTKPNRKRCCTLDGRRLVNRRDPACYAIVVDEHDPVYAPAGVRCMNLVRTTRDACSKRGTEQLNDATSFLDLSLVYGSDWHTAKSLRLFKTGLLKMGLSSVGRSVLPPAHNSSDVCDLVNPHEACYRAGDIRVNQNPQHTLLQTVLLREHNRLALALAHLNPHWGDERLYQEARRIFIAEHQHITYTEYLPIILGWDAMKRYEVWPDDHHEYAWDYDPKTDPSVVNEHAAAAFRYLHTNIQGLISLVTEHRQSFNTLRLSDHFSRPDVIQRANNFDHLVRGLTTQCQHGTDRFATDETMQFMFRNGRKLGLDLCAIDTQRSRDHGIPSYNNIRHYCGLHKAHSWEDFKDLIEHELVEKMSRLYKHPDDVDLIVGGSLETLVHGAQFGPTFLCITSEQFRRTRRGDRFFYHFKSAGFTPEQLKEIRKSNAARLLCDNSDGIKLMQPKAFWKISDENPLVPCKKLPTMDLRAWKEEKGKFFEVHGHLKEAESPWKDFHDKLPVYGPWPEGHDVWKKDDLPLYEVKDKFPKGHSDLSDIEKPWKDIHDEFPYLFGPWQEDHDVWKNEDVPFLEELNDWKKTDSPWVGSVGDWKGEVGDPLWPDKKAYWGEGNHAWNDNPLGWKGVDGKWGDDYSDWAKEDSAWNLGHDDFKDLYSPVLSNLKGADSWKGNLGGLKDIEIPFVKGYSGLQPTDDLWTDGGIDLKYDDGWEKDYKNLEMGDETWKEDIEDWKDDDGPWDQGYKVKKARGDVDDNFKVKVSLAIK